MKILLAIILSVTLCGCQYDPHAGNYTTHEPTVEEIVGVYVLDRIYMESHSPGIGAKVSELSAPPLIHVLADGTFIAERFPYFAERPETESFFDLKFEDFRNLGGRWEQATVATIGNGSGESKKHYGILVEELPTHLGRFGFTGEPKVDGLIIGFGDPDSGDAITYKKKKPNKAEMATPRKPSD
jgi:hypothetical protein